MNSIRMIPAAALLLFAVGCSDLPVAAITTATAASADLTAGSCSSEMADVRAAIADASFASRNGERERANLLGKVDEAEAKIAEGKGDDAFAKLEDIRAAVTALSTPDAKGKTKLDAHDAAAILAAVDAAEQCITDNSPATI